MTWLTLTNTSALGQLSFRLFKKNFLTTRGGFPAKTVGRARQVHCSQGWDRKATPLQHLKRPRPFCWDVTRIRLARTWGKRGDFLVKPRAVHTAFVSASTRAPSTCAHKWKQCFLVVTCCSQFKIPFWTYILNLLAQCCTIGIEGVELRRHMYICMYVSMYICKYVSLYVCMCECMYVCMYVCKNVCM